MGRVRGCNSMRRIANRQDVWVLLADGQRRPEANRSKTPRASAESHGGAKKTRKDFCACTALLTLICMRAGGGEYLRVLLEQLPRVSLGSTTIPVSIHGQRSDGVTHWPEYILVR